MEAGRSHQASENAAPPYALVIFGLLIANVALAVGGGLVREADTGPVASAFWRMALAVPLLFLITRKMGQTVKLGSGTLMFVMAISGIFFAADLAFWHLGILQTRLANAALFGNAASLLYPIWGFIVVKSLPDRTQSAALMLGLVGALLLLGRSYELSPQYLVGDLLCLAAGIFYTFFLIVVARAKEAVPAWALLSWSTLFTAPPLLLLALYLDEAILPTNWLPLVGLAFGSQIIGQGLLIWVIDKVSPLMLGVAMMTQPVVSAVIGWIAFGERLAVADLAGAALVAVALVLVRR
jgi:drug/metabolite transporter (DMT)-like permease